MSIVTGNVVQLTGLLVGSIALRAAALTRSADLALIKMLVGWVLLYFCCHAIAHWSIGRLLGIRFCHYTLGGAGNPRMWPPGIRWLFEHLPFFGVQTDRVSMQRTSTGARAAMWSAGATASVIVPCLGALWAWRAGVPGGGLLFIFTVVWSIGTILSNFRSGGDYFKAIQALRG